MAYHFEKQDYTAIFLGINLRFLPYLQRCDDLWMTWWFHSQFRQNRLVIPRSLIPGRSSMQLDIYMHWKGNNIKKIKLILQRQGTLYSDITDTLLYSLFFLITLLFYLEFWMFFYRFNIHFFFLDEIEFFYIKIIQKFLMMRMGTKLKCTMTMICMLFVFEREEKEYC